MKKSNAVKLVLVAAIAAGCSPDPTPRRCVDKVTGKVVEDKVCESVLVPANPGMSYVPFIWYYGGGGGYAPGSHFSGGTYVAPSRGGYYSPSRSGGYRSSGSSASSGTKYSPTTRGGFGGSARVSVGS